MAWLRRRGCMTSKMDRMLFRLLGTLPPRVLAAASLRDHSSPVVSRLLAQSALSPSARRRRENAREHVLFGIREESVRKAFTLIELLVVLAMIGLLAGR